jgi:hypothetical protein
MIAALSITSTLLTQWRISFNIKNMSIFTKRSTVHPNYSILFILNIDFRKQNKTKQKKSPNVLIAFQNNYKNMQQGFMVPAYGNYQ